MHLHRWSNKRDGRIDPLRCSSRSCLCSAEVKKSIHIVLYQYCLKCSFRARYPAPYSDPATEEALYETTILRQFSGLRLARIPEETTILNFRRLLEKHELAAGFLAVINGYPGDRGQGTIVDATLIQAPSATKNRDGKRNPECTRPRKATSTTSA